MFRVINSFHKGTLSNCLTAIADIWRTETGGADFLDKLIAPAVAFLAEFTVLRGFAGALPAAKILSAAVHPVFTFIKREARISCSNLR